MKDKWAKHVILRPNMNEEKQLFLEMLGIGDTNRNNTLWAKIEMYQLKKEKAEEEKDKPTILE